MQNQAKKLDKAAKKLRKDVPVVLSVGNDIGADYREDAVPPAILQKHILATFGIKAKSEVKVTEADIKAIEHQRKLQQLIQFDKWFYDLYKKYEDQPESRQYFQKLYPEFFRAREKELKAYFELQKRWRKKILEPITDAEDLRFYYQLSTNPELREFIFDDNALKERRPIAKADDGYQQGVLGAKWKKRQEEVTALRQYADGVLFGGAKQAEIIAFLKMAKPTEASQPVNEKEEGFKRLFGGLASYFKPPPAGGAGGAGSISGPSESGAGGAPPPRAPPPPTGGAGGPPAPVAPPPGRTLTEIQVDIDKSTYAIKTLSDSLPLLAEPDKQRAETDILALRTKMEGLEKEKAEAAARETLSSKAAV